MIIKSAHIVGSSIWIEIISSGLGCKGGIQILLGNMMVIGCPELLLARRLMNDALYILNIERDVWSFNLWPDWKLGRAGIKLELVEISIMF